MFEVRLDKLNWLEDKYIKEFEKEPIQEGLILFYGDSTFTRWKEEWGHRPLEQDIRRKDGSVAAVNHGFGTSTAEELLYYYHRVVRPWKPRALVLTVFGNDLGAGYTPAEIMFLISRICAYARTDMPGIRIFLCNDRANLKHRGRSAELNLMKQMNKLKAEYCAIHDDCTLVDLANWPEFYDSAEHVGDPDHSREELFDEDQVHCNQDGYDVYRRIFLHYLDDLL